MSESVLKPEKELLRILDQELDTAAIAEQRGQKIYRSVQQLSQLIGGEYGDRVVYELLQNAHDAQSDGPGRVAIRLVVHSSDQADLFVANEGIGFNRENLDAIRNIANSTKEIGEGIGNKGVGFRSVEALTDDPRVYSCCGKAEKRDYFDGYCFRFASPDEVKTRLVQLGKQDVAASVASDMPRYLATMPADEQPEKVIEFARDGFATVVALQLKSAETVQLAIRQIEALLATDAPVLLFLDRISRLDVYTEGIDHIKHHTPLTREVAEFPENEINVASSRFEFITLGPERQRWLMVRYTIPKEDVLKAVNQSISMEPGMKRWRDWRGEAVVSVAVPTEGTGLTRGRLYNFLPMGADAHSPFFGHLDAPFFTAINRERARLDLPLNKLFLGISAGVCAEAALVLTKSTVKIPSRCVVDLAAWRTEFAMLQMVFGHLGTELLQAKIWPTTAGGWGKFGTVHTWSNGNFNVFSPSRATKAGAHDILCTKLSADRVTAIENLARFLNTTCGATGQAMAGWAEKIADSLQQSGKVNHLGELYADLARAFRPDELVALKGRRILLDRNLRLVAAGEDVYVRQEGDRRRQSEGAPLPPKNIAQKLTILSETVSLNPETVIQFERAGLLRHYVATEILERLPKLFGDRPAVERRKSALLWAFEVWKHDGSGTRRVLELADLHVPARSGWRPARLVSFSQTWSDAGSDLETYLAEARARCTDCDAAAGDLLFDRKEWPAPVADKDREWFRFLSDAGVVDGLVAIPATVPDWPIQGENWMYYLSVTKDPALDAVWLQKCGLATPLSHPRTNYSRHGEVFKLPGQAIVHELSDEARRRFAALVVRHLQSFGNKHLQFDLLSNPSSRGTQDRRTLYSPLATFLFKAAWFPMESGSELEFVPIANGWVITDRRTQPKFVPRAIEEIASILAKDGPATELLAANGLRFWRDKATAADRIEALAEVCDGVSQHERPILRKCYDEAWRDVIELGQPLPPEVRLVLERPTGFASIAGTEPPTCVYVRTEQTADLAKLLIDTGDLVLATSADCPHQEVISTISATGGFDAQPTDEADIRLLVNGEPFLANLADPLLVDVVPWLAEALVLGHELGARSLEKSAHVQAVLERLRRLRLRKSLSIELASGVGTAKRLQRYLHRDDVCPTLIVEGRFDAEQLGDSASLIALYAHPNLRTFELLLVRLAPRLSAKSEPLSVRPTDDEYAYAIQADLDSVREHLSAYRHDDSHKVELIVPLIAYHVGVKAARELAAKLSISGFTQWASLIGEYLDQEQVHELIAAIEKTEDLAILRKDLNLDYAHFNRVLVQLDRTSLTSESELRRLFDLWKSDLKQQFSDRLRRHFAPQFDDDDELKKYAEFRSLDFITFNETWVETHETLGPEDVAQYVDRIFTDKFGEDPGGELDGLESLRKANRKVVASVAERAKPILWALASDQISPEWHGSATDIAAKVDLSGLLDIHSVDETEVIAIMARVGLWPEGVEQTLDLATHGLSQDDLEHQKTRVAEQQVQEQRRRNQVEFAGKVFYADEADFVSQFASVVHAAFAESDWQSRSKTSLAKLRIQPEPVSSRLGNAGGGGGRRGTPKPPEAIRIAIGLAGELLAYEYLKSKYPKHFSDNCWISENRTSLFPEPGDDSRGYDFRVNTLSTEWLYEVKATVGDACEFELSDNEYRVAVSTHADRSRRYRILFVQNAFDPSHCRIIELPNPASDAGRARIRVVGRSSQRMRFELG